MTANMQYFAPLKKIIKNYLPDEQIKSIKKAYIFAYLAHIEQFRSSSEPYITHPVQVAAILARMKLDYKAITAALLHDTIEDTDVTFDDVCLNFDHETALLVDGVSKLDKLKFRNRQEAQVENFRKMVLAMVKDVRVILIKLADRMHNMRTLDSLRPDKRRRIAKETLEIYTPLAHRLGIHHIKTELEVLSFKAIYPHRAFVIEQVINGARKTRKKLISQIISEINDKLQQNDIKAAVEIDEKNIYFIYQKMLQHQQNFRSIMDICIFRIIVNEVDECYRVLGLIHNLYKPRLNRFKDYIAIPKINGYQSLHTSLVGPHGSPVEVQIRTSSMNQIALMGIATCCVYDKIEQNINSTTQIKTQSWMQNLLELQQSAGNSFEFIENVKSDLFPKQIYLFTPKGRIIELPKGATPVDMAYAIHSDIGHHCVGAMVDRKPYPLSQPLYNGQTVEIITSSQSYPNSSWLQFVVSARAKTGIRQAIKNMKQGDAIKLGKQLLDHLLTDSDKTHLLTPSLKKLLLTKTNMTHFDEFLAEVGLGKISSDKLAFLLNTKNKHDITAKTADHKLMIEGTKGQLVTLAKCCHPVHGDPIIGHFTPDEGLFVHHESCSNVINKNMQNDNYMALMWSEFPMQLFLAELWIDITHNTAHALANIIATISHESANVHWLNTEEKDALIHTVVMHVEVKDLTQLTDIIKKISHQPDVINIYRNIN